MKAVPVLLSSAEKYDVEKGGEFFQYLQFRLLLVEELDSIMIVPNGEATLLEVGDVGNFFEQIGSNTRYIIHPEEILADNFAFMVLERDELPSPHIIEKMHHLLARN